MMQRDMLLPFLGLKSKPNKKLTLSTLVVGYMALYPRRQNSS
jgi:hypothetical protein